MPLPCDRIDSMTAPELKPALVLLLAVLLPALAFALTLVLLLLLLPLAILLLLLLVVLVLATFESLPLYCDPERVVRVASSPVNVATSILFVNTSLDSLRRVLVRLREASANVPGLFIVPAGCADDSIVDGVWMPADVDGRGPFVCCSLHIILSVLFERRSVFDEVGCIDV